MWNRMRRRTRNERRHSLLLQFASDERDQLLRAPASPSLHATIRPVISDVLPVAAPRSPQMSEDAAYFGAAGDDRGLRIVAKTR
jgi:hypothetical protein